MKEVAQQCGGWSAWALSGRGQRPIGRSPGSGPNAGDLVARKFRPKNGAQGRAAPIFVRLRVLSADFGVTFRATPSPFGLVPGDPPIGLRSAPNELTPKSFRMECAIRDAHEASAEGGRLSDEHARSDGRRAAALVRTPSLVEHAHSIARPVAL